MWTHPSVLYHFLVLWQSWVSGLAKLRTKSCTKGTQGGSLGAPQWQLVSLSCIFTLLNLRAVWISCWNVFSLTVFLSHIQTHPSILCNMMLDLEFWIHFFFVSSDQLSHSVMSDSLQPHGLQHARLPCPSPTPGACSNSCPLCQWCNPTFLSSVVPFSSCLQSFPASGSFPMSQFFPLGGQSIEVSAWATVLLMNIQDWSPLVWTDWISLLFKRLSRVFSNTTV